MRDFLVLGFRKLFALVWVSQLFGVTACVSDKERLESKQIDEKNRILSEVVRPGMTLQELKDLGVTLSNCTGNPKRPTYCDGTYEKASKSSRLGNVLTASARETAHSLGESPGPISSAGSGVTVENHLGYGAKSKIHKMYFSPEGVLTRIDSSEGVR